MDSDVRAALRTAILNALPPIDVRLVEAIIVPYATDRQSIVRYYRESSDRRQTEIDRLSDLKRTDDALATMVRYPSFVSVDWLASIRRRKADVFRYFSIEYTPRSEFYGVFDITINYVSTTRFDGCPNSRNFCIGDVYADTSIDRINISAYIDNAVADEIVPILTDFARTGQCDVDQLLKVARSIRQNTAIVYQILPVVYTYFRLTELVRRGICLNTDDVCDGCQTKPIRFLSSASTVRPFPAELYDGDDDG